MAIEFDEKKDAENIAKHGLSLSHANQFNWDSAFYAVDDRRDYKEERINALGYVDKRLHVLTFTYRRSNYRIISLRKANLRERRKYEKEKNNQ